MMVNHVDACEPEQAVLFFDLDGTLVWRDHEAAARGEDVPQFDKIAPSPAVYRAFARLRERGHVPCLCTGRSLCQIPDSIRELEPVGYLAEAGSYASVGGTVIRDARIPFDQLSATVVELERLGIDAEFESNEGLLGFYPTQAAPRFPDFPVAHSASEFMVRAQEMPIAKFCVHDYSTVNYGDLVSFAQGRYGMCDLTHDVLEFSMLGFDKGTAIRSVLDYLGHDKKNTFAFGDSENDLPMAREVEHFVALGNALDEVKRAAYYVTLPVWEDGVPFALERLGLI